MFPWTSESSSPRTSRPWRRQSVANLEGHIKFFKVGLQLFLSGWFDIIEWILDRELKVFVDLKFFDVPETVRLALRR